tara:strand:- start:37 stop:207 length:171 start_codon:yes stop_codon:yes gene_type:complete
MVKKYLGLPMGANRSGLGHRPTVSLLSHVSSDRFCAPQDNKIHFILAIAGPEPAKK